MVSGIRKGFSLIELLIASGIILTITGLAISNYGSFADTQRIRQAGKTLQNNLHFIQNRAIASVKPRECDQNNPILAYRVSFTENAYTYVPVCSNGILQNANATIVLPDRITFSPPPSSFDFLVLTGKPTRSVTMTITNGIKRYEIRVTESGSIEDLGFQ